MMRIIIHCCILPIVLSFPSNNFLSPGRQENYLAAGFYRAEKSDGVQSVDDLGGGFWPSAKFLMLRRRNKGKVTDAPTKNNDDALKATTSCWDVVEGTATTFLPQTTTVAPVSIGTTVVSPIVVPLPPSPTIDQVALRAKLLKGTPPKFLESGSDDAKFSFATIGMGEKLTKAQLRQAYTEWAETQDPRIKEAFYRQRDEHDMKVNGMRKNMAEKSKNKLSTEAKTLFDQIQSIHDNENLTIDENIGLVQEVMNSADESVRKELRDMKKRFVINI